MLDLERAGARKRVGGMLRALYTPVHPSTSLQTLYRPADPYPPQNLQDRRMDLERADARRRAVGLLRAWGVAAGAQREVSSGWRGLGFVFEVCVRG